MWCTSPSSLPDLVGNDYVLAISVPARKKCMHEVTLWLIPFRVLWSVRPTSWPPDLLQKGQILFGRACQTVQGHFVLLIVPVSEVRITAWDFDINI